MDLDKIKRFRFPTIYIILFIIFAMLLDSLTLFFLASFIFSAILLFIKRDAVLTMIGISYANAGKIVESKNILVKLINKGTKHAPCYAFYGNMLLMDTKVDEAIDIIEKGLLLDTDSTTYKNLNLILSSSYWVKGDIKKAISLLENIQSKYDYLNHSVLATLGYLYFLDGNIELARKTSLLALEDNENSSAALDNMGQIEFKAKNIPLAKEYFNKALEVRENLVDSLYYMGLISIEEHNLDDAKAYLNKALYCHFSVMNSVTKEMVINALSEIE